MSTLIAYKGDKKLKALLIEEIEAHRKADQIVQGTYGKGEGKEWKGCAVGCSIHSLNERLKTSYSTGDHAVYEQALGIPEWLAHLEDTIFEGLPVEEAKKWPGRFAKAINVGANLEPVKWHFTSFILKENIERVLTLDIADDLKKQVVDAIRGVLSVAENAIQTGVWDESAGSAARSAAESAASAAWSAWSAAFSAAWSAESAARSAASAAWSAAFSAAWSAAFSAAWSAESAARSAAYQRYADELLRILKATK